VKLFGELIAQVPLSSLGQIEAVLGKHLVRLELLRIEIEALRYSAEQDLWQERLAALAVFALMGAVIGCVLVTHAVR
jgi:hypothetical protein